MKRLLIPLLLAALACNAPVQAEPTAEPTEEVVVDAPTEEVAAATTTEGGESEATSAPQPTTAPQATAIPAPDGPPAITSINFTTNPQVFTTDPIPSFDEGVQEIFGVFAFENMSPGTPIRREWYLNGALWVGVDREWDYAKYGEDGTVQDVSIYDRDDYLPAGSWTVQFYINGEPQFSELPAFYITSDNIADPTYTEGETRRAFVTDETTLNVDGAEVVTMRGPIHTMAWFPDEIHMAVSIVTNIDEDTGVGFWIREFEMYVVNVDTGEIVSQIGEASDSFHRPNVSPNGQWVAVYAGSGFGDGCGVDLRLGFIELDNAFNRLRAYTMNDIEPFAAVAGQLYPANDDGVVAPGVWTGDTTFKAAIASTCVDPPEAPEGIYTFDVPNLTATRTGNFHNPPLAAP